MGGHGSKTRTLDLLESEILARLDSGATYAQIACRLSKEGFHVSENTIAAWRKKKRREKRAGETTTRNQETLEDRAGVAGESKQPQAHEEAGRGGDEGKGDSKRSLRRTRTAAKNPYRHS